MFLFLVCVVPEFFGPLSALDILFRLQLSSFFFFVCADTVHAIVCMFTVFS